MKIRDAIYGTVVVSDSVLISLLNNQAIRRLKGISQSGLPQEYNPLKTYSRYEHSVGVMLILRRLGASLENQVVGLLHDVSHLAFSHVAEWAISEELEKGEKLDLNENLMTEFVMKSDIPSILKKNKIEPLKVVSLYNYPLVMDQMPNVYCDYLDYSIRDINYWFNSEIVEILDHIKIFNNKIVFTDIQKALIYAENTLKLQIECYGGVDNIIRYYLLSKALKYAIKKKLIGVADFYGTEEKILLKIRKSKAKRIVNSLNLLKRKNLKQEQGTFNETIKKRFYYIIPQVMVEGKVVPLTEISNEYKIQIEKYKGIYENGIKI